MKYLGIDYGSKRIGLASSTPDGAMAFPHSIIEVKGRATDTLAKEVAAICMKDSIEAIVIGESKNYQGGDNAIMAAVNEFIKAFAAVSTIPVHTYPEFMTSHQAAAFQGQHDKLDSSAAAIILQSYLDAHKLS